MWLKNHVLIDEEMGGQKEEKCEIGKIGLSFSLTLCRWKILILYFLFCLFFLKEISVQEKHFQT